MPIQRQRIYTPAEVEAIVRSSELRPSRTRQTGHAGSRHVLITNLELSARGDKFARAATTDVPLAGAFVGNVDAFRAVAEALNSPQGQAALACLDANYPTGIRVRIEAQVHPVKARYSSGFNIVRKAMVTAVLVLVERIEDATMFGIHIHTAFPILWFRRGVPAWIDHRNMWH